MSAHVAGLPLEELLPSLAGAGAALLAARVWLERTLARPGRRGRRSPR